MTPLTPEEFAVVEASLGDQLRALLRDQFDVQAQDAPAVVAWMSQRLRENAGLELDPHDQRVIDEAVARIERQQADAADQNHGSDTRAQEDGDDEQTA